jgi:hypothetical protein
MKKLLMMTGALLVASTLGCSGGDESAALQTPNEQPAAKDAAEEVGDQDEQPVEDQMEQPVEVAFLISGML